VPLTVCFPNAKVIAMQSDLLPPQTLLRLPAPIPLLQLVLPALALLGLVPQQAMMLVPVGLPLRKVAQPRFACSHLHVARTTWTKMRRNPSE
jgi:hypothetical protein